MASSTTGHDDRAFTAALADARRTPLRPAAAEPASLALIALTERVGARDVTVLINGPTGTGKEGLARLIHASSPRRDAPFVAVNCAALPEAMLEALLFGHERGAFTGAQVAAKGLMRAAHGGTLLLDEIAELPLGSQAKLLRALQEREVLAIFVRDRAAPTASVLVVLAGGRTLSEAQVRAIVHLVASAVPGLAPTAVSVVDQTGALLSGGDTGDLGESGRMLDVEARTAAQLRQRIVQLLTPIVGAANFTAQVTADLDFAENAATRESLAPGILVSEQGSSATETPPPPARGIPGALSNTIPQAAQVSTTPPPALALAAAAPVGTSTFTRSYEIGKAVSVTRAARGTLRRLSVAVVIRDGALGAPKDRAAQVAILTGLVRSAVGFDARRGDVVTLAARAFVAADADAPPAWWQAYLSGAGQGALGLAGLAMLVFGVVRPWLRARSNERLAALEAPPPLAPRLDYDARLAETRLLAGADPARTTAVMRGLLRTAA